MRKYIYLFTLIFLAAIVQAQNIPFDKKLFKERKDEFKEAKANLDMGNDIFNMFNPGFIEITNAEYIDRKIGYREALPLLYKAHKFNPNNSELNYKIGRCYLMNTVYKEESITHLKKSLELDPTVAHDIQYHLGIGYHIAMDFDNAIIAFKKYKEALVSKNPIEHEDLQAISYYAWLKAKMMNLEPYDVLLDITNSSYEN